MNDSAAGVIEKEWQNSGVIMALVPGHLADHLSRGVALPVSRMGMPDQLLSRVPNDHKNHRIEQKPCRRR